MHYLHIQMVHEVQPGTSGLACLLAMLEDTALQNPQDMQLVSWLPRNSNSNLTWLADTAPTRNT